jgi:antitoxin YefM
MDFILPVSEVRRRLPALVKLIKKEEKNLIITKNGKPVAVMITPEMLETLEILSDPKLMAALKRAEAGVAKGRVYTHEEVFKGV